jgi:hypothetical protein
MLRSLGIILLLSHCIFCEIDIFGNAKINVAFSEDPNLAEFSLSGVKGFYYGFGLGQAMKDADIHLFVPLADGKYTVKDTYSNKYGSPQEDITLGPNGSNDLLDVVYTDLGNNFIITYKRKLNTGDSFDKILTATGNNYIIAIGKVSDNGAIIKHAKDQRRGGSFDIDPHVGNLRTFFE